MARMMSRWFTFDDGPSQFTPAILDVLDRHCVKGLFFVSGVQIVGNQNIVREIFARGHELGNHSWSHSNLKDLSYSEVTVEIGMTSKVIQAITGRPPSTFRPPYGSLSPIVRKVAARMSLDIIPWSLDSYDWRLGTATEIAERILGLIHPNAVILMHDGCADRNHSPHGLISADRSATVVALSRVLLPLKLMGYSPGLPTDLVV